MRRVAARNAQDAEDLNKTSVRSKQEPVSGDIFPNQRYVFTPTSATFSGRCLQVEIDLAVGVGAAVSPVVSEGGDARVGCRDVLGLLGQVAIVAVVPRVVLVGGHFDHVVAGGRGSRRIGVGGGGVVGADPGFENKTAGVEDLPSDGAAGRDGFVTAVTAEKPKVSQRQQ